MRNLAKFDVLPPEGLNLESVLRHKTLVLTRPRPPRRWRAALCMNDSPTSSRARSSPRSSTRPARSSGSTRSSSTRRRPSTTSRARSTTLFKVNVEDVRTCIVRGKIKRVGKSIGKRPNFKKAIVTLKEGDKIELFEGGAV